MAVLPLVLQVPLADSCLLPISHLGNQGESKPHFPDPVHSQGAWGPTRVVGVVPQISGRLRVALSGGL